jgi:L-threonylcarbamoyladenylate synthase
MLFIAISKLSSAFKSTLFRTRTLSTNPISSFSYSKSRMTNQIETDSIITVGSNQKKAKYISSSEESMVQAGARLRSGYLVSFPTETVYGLGCHAIDPVAVQRVFDAKERPLSDPLIVHVNEAPDALKLWKASSSTTTHDTTSNDMEEKALRALTETFWPGPLTIVAKADDMVPSIIMANTGFVACRSPSHPVARALIEASGIPLAAPSANKFGHVSPTRASHVMDDLYMEDVWIVDPYLEKERIDDFSATQDNVVCDVGVESTVAKIEMKSDAKGQITILRHGAISAEELMKCIRDANLEAVFDVVEKMQATGDDVNHVAPGQTIRHYSPNVLSYMIASSRYQNIENEWSAREKEIVKTAVVIDFGGRLASLKDSALAYRDLSVDGNPSVAAAHVFDTLRWSELVQGAQRVYFPEINVGGKNEAEALALAVKDRLTRAASGVVIDSLM